MEKSTKIILGVLGGLAVLGVSWIGYKGSSYSQPRMVSKSGKHMMIRFRGKNTEVDVQKLSDTGQAMMLGAGWSVKPMYGNESDKKTLAGLDLQKGGVGYNNWFF